MRALILATIAALSIGSAGAVTCQRIRRLHLLRQVAPHRNRSAISPTSIRHPGSRRRFANGSASSLIATESVGPAG